MKYDAIVIGAGPNGLSAAVELARNDLNVLVIEGQNTIGGGTRTAELTLPGFKHDICSAIHPMAPCSPFFSSLPLEEYGLEWITPPCAVAHPFDEGSAALMFQSIEQTAERLGVDASVYLSIYQPLVQGFEKINEYALGPMIRVPRHPLTFTPFGLQALLPATLYAKRFKTKEAKGLFAGLAAHAIADFANLSTTAVGLTLAMSGHINGWPFPKGGAQAITNALAGYFKSLGGEIETGQWVTSIEDLPLTRAILFDLSPKNIAKIARKRLPNRYAQSLNRWKHGPGVCKVDLALSGPIPWKNSEISQTATVHLGGTFEEIAASEAEVWAGHHSDNPYVLLAQHTLFDESRAPEGQHTCWAYCHVPNGSNRDESETIINQIERFAPGFRDLIIGKHVMTSQDYESYNPNYMGGDIVGGAFTLPQLISRPALHPDPYRIPTDGLYICSASTPPGAGIHGMSGFNAAKSALRHTFGKG